MPRPKNSSFNACLTKVSSFNRVRFIRNDWFFFLKQTGAVLKVEVQVRFPTIELSRNTPVMQAVVFEDPSDSRFLSVWPVSQVKKKCTKTFEQFTPSFPNNTNLSHTTEVKRTLVGLWRLLELLFF